LRTLIVSDLHLGSAGRVDLLRKPELRRVLIEEMREADRVVLAGDLLELRHGPRREALAAARPFFEDLGRALAGREVVVMAGNHDHALIEPWLQRRGELPAPEPLGAEQLIEVARSPAAPSAMVAQLAEWAAPARRVSAAYPGLWVRDDVYVTHGHYLDCHLTVPTLERLGIGVTGRMLRRPEASLKGPDDYEAVMGPVFAWIDAVARQAPTGETLNGATTVRAWRALGGGSSGSGGGGSRTRALRTRALTGSFKVAVAALNRAGVGRFNADLSSGELRRAGLRAMGEVAERLGLSAAGAAGHGQSGGPARPAYVVFGHTHRAGPLERDREEEWRAGNGTRLVNAGCWTYDSWFLTPTPGESPYWPGCCVVVEDEGPPVLRRLLQTRTHAELAPA
jgi:Calcineurin-like phosphoesterase superfamily domain